MLVFQALILRLCRMAGRRAVHHAEFCPPREIVLDFGSRFRYISKPANGNPGSSENLRKIEGIGEEKKGGSKQPALQLVLMAITTTQNLVNTSEVTT